ncbi:MAG: helix-turn-helix transcriptional regulator [Candidatus Aquicultorales bacterium]
MSARRIGLGLIQGWLWLFFLNGPLLFASIAPPERAGELFAFFLAAHALTFFSAVLLAARLGLRRPPVAVVFAGGIVASAGTLALGGHLLGLPAPSGTMELAAGVAAAAGGALVVVSWGEVFASVTTEKAALMFGGSVLLGTGLFYGVGELPMAAQIAVTAALPVLSAILLPPKAQAGAAENGPGLLRDFPFPLPIVALIVTYCIVGGIMYRMINLAAFLPAQQAYWLTNVIYAAVIAVAVSAVYRFNLDLRLVYRPILPLLGAGFVLFPLLKNSLAIIPFSLFQAGFALFDVYTWLLFAYVASRRSDPLRVFGWGLFILTGSIIGGEIVMRYLPSSLMRGETIDSVSLVGALVMLAATILLRDSKETYAGWPLGTNGAFAADGERAANEQPGLEIRGGDFISNEPRETQPAAARLAVMEAPSPASKIDCFASEYNLTARERQVVILLVQGRNNPFIRERLNISDNTLKTHLRNIYHKTSSKNRQQLLSIFND